jgi:hypothetical protein
MQCSTFFIKASSLYIYIIYIDLGRKERNRRQRTLEVIGDPGVSDTTCIQTSGCILFC